MDSAVVVPRRSPGARYVVIVKKEPKQNKEKIG
jgi:hypothetical protein